LRGLEIDDLDGRVSGEDRRRIRMKSTAWELELEEGTTDLLEPFTDCGEEIWRWRCGTGIESRPAKPRV